jgi:hypothetical protein
MRHLRIAKNEILSNRQPVRRILVRGVYNLRDFRPGSGLLTATGAELVTAAAAATAGAAGAGAARGSLGGAAGYRGAEYGKLDGRLLGGALRAGDLLLSVDDDFLEFGFAVFADVFVDWHWVGPY